MRTPDHVGLLIGFILFAVVFLVIVLSGLMMMGNDIEQKKHMDQSLPHNTWCESE